MKLTVLIENTTQDPLLHAEHGLSLYIEKNDFHFLFDTGQTHLFLENAKTLGIDLSQLDAIAFSHNHYDHCGGFLSLVKQGYPVCPVYAHIGFFRRKWWNHSLDDVDEPTHEKTWELVGPVMTPDYFFQNGYAEFRMISDDVFEVTKDIYLIGNFPVDRGEETPHPSSTMEIDPDTFVSDQFRDEQICVLRTQKGLVILTGCAHNGIINILNTIERHFPNEQIHAIFGGTHLVQSTEPRILHTIDYINHKQLKTVGVCHCTGTEALEQFANKVPNYLAIGTGFSWSDETYSLE